MPKIKPKLNKLKGHTGALGGVIVTMAAITALPQLKDILPASTYEFVTFFGAVLIIISKSIQE